MVQLRIEYPMTGERTWEFHEEAAAMRYLHELIAAGFYFEATLMGANYKSVCDAPGFYRLAAK